MLHQFVESRLISSKFALKAINMRPLSEKGILNIVPVNDIQSDN